MKAKLNWARMKERKVYTEELVLIPLTEFLILKNHFGISAVDWRVVMLIFRLVFVGLAIMVLMFLI